MARPPPNTSRNAWHRRLAQGCGFGRRAHPGDGHSLAGGIGILAEGAGNDTYSSGVFGQGVSYWYALGMLVDRAGDDVYHGVWYAQGSSAHYAVAAHCDLAGNDTYVASMNQSQGHGRDFSTGVLYDAAGNDSYECPGTAMGSANMNGIGVLRDAAGDDTYTTSALSLGYADNSRPGSLCLGLFRDAAGTNRFSENSAGVAGEIWILARPEGDQLLYGVGAAR